MSKFKVQLRGRARAARPLLLICLLSGATLLALGGFGWREALARQKSAARTHTVLIKDFKYEPESLTVKAGDTVIWKNEDIVPHTATAERKSFDSKNIAAKASWQYVANKPGIYPYICTYHPTMKAKLIVK